jgi:hypothetical protein
VNDDDATPVMYDHCVKVFEEMQKTATIKEAEGGVRIAVWEGYLTRLIQQDLDLAVPYYSAIRAHLIRMGSVKQLRRGGGSSKSQWEVVKPPTKELFETAQATGSQRLQQKETHIQRINDLTQRVARLEQNERALAEALSHLQGQFAAHINANGHEEVA